MSIADQLKKAAGLFVVMPEPEERSVPEAATTSGGAASDIPEGDDLDARLAAMSQTLAGVKPGAGVASPPAATPAAAPSPRTVKEIVAASEGPNLDAIQVPVSDSPPPFTDDGGLDFPSLYAQAALPTEPFTVEQTLEMIQSLPANLPMEVKRQTIQATVATMGKAIGATPETIVADASRKLAALASYADQFTRQTGEFVAAGEFEIQHLLEQVEEKRKGILAAKEQQARIQQLCGAEADRLDDVLEFFSLDVEPSKYAGATPPPLPSNA